MGMNTLALLNEAHIENWPAEIREAALALSNEGPSGRGVKFSYGHILARSNNEAPVILSVHGNTGAEIEDAIAEGRARKGRQNEVILRQLRYLLCGHGYTVRRADRSRGEGPLSWGFAEELKSGKQTLPETSPVVSGSAAGVAVILLNDFTERWPEEMKVATNRFATTAYSASFEYGCVLSVAHADYTQIAGISRASGQLLRSDRFVDQRFLDHVAQILLRNGHAVRQPSAKSYIEPTHAAQ